VAIEFGPHWLSHHLLSPDDRERVDAALWALSVQTPTLQISYQIIRPDGTVLCVEQHVRAFFDNDGKLKRMVGMIADVTDRKRGEQEINRKLIEAQEKERSRIGRELHDNINQRLALLSVGLGQLQEHPSDGGRVQELRNEVEEISEDVQPLSHALHSSNNLWG
jgi:signal transduction histidine kinase